MSVLNIMLVLLLMLLPGNDEVELKPGDTSPSFFARTLEGKDFFLSRKVGSRARNNRGPVAISFFTTSCIPCRKEIPHIEKLAGDFPEVEFYLFNVGEAPDLVKRYVDKMNYSLPVLLDRYGSVAKKMGANVTPTFILINEDGVVEMFKQGFHDEDAEAIEACFNKCFRNSESESDSVIVPAIPDSVKGE